MADRQVSEGLAILGHVEQKLKHYLPDPNMRPSDALHPTYKDFRTERFSAWMLTGKESALGARVVKYSEELLAALSQAEFILGLPPTPNDALGRLHFARGRVNALIGRWIAARTSYEKGLFRV